MKFIHLIPKPIIALTICSDANLVEFEYFGFLSYSSDSFGAVSEQLGSATNLILPPV